MKAFLKHPSAGGEDFYTFAFLGDALIELFLRQKLLRIYPKDLKRATYERAILASTRALAYLSRKYRIDKLVIHNLEELSDYVLASAYEAFVATLYHKHDFYRVELFLERTLWKEREYILQNYDDFLSKLYNEIQNHKFLVDREDKFFKVTLLVDGKPVGTVQERSKRDAIYKLARSFFLEGKA